MKSKRGQRMTRLSYHPVKKGFAPFSCVIVFVKGWTTPCSIRLLLWVVVAVTHSPQTAEDAEVFLDRIYRMLSCKLRLFLISGAREAKSKAAQRKTR